MKADQIDTTIPEMVQAAIQSIDKDSEVILFGSRARGDFRSDSDWDFLVLLTQEITRPLKDQIRDALYDIELKVDQVISSIIYERSNWDRLSETPLYQIIEEEGVEL